MNELECSELCAQVVYALKNRLNTFPHDALVRLEVALRERIRWDEDTNARCNGIKFGQSGTA